MQHLVRIAHGHVAGATGAAACAAADISASQGCREVVLQQGSQHGQAIQMPPCWFAVDVDFVLDLVDSSEQAKLRKPINLLCTNAFAWSIVERWLLQPSFVQMLARCAYRRAAGQSGDTGEP